MDITVLTIIASGVVVGIGASFTGLGGGFLMIPILLCSVVAVAVFLERMWTLRGRSMSPKAVAKLQSK